MAVDTDKLIENIMQSYEKYDTTVRIDAENMLNKEILTEIIYELQKVLFPGFFDKHRIRSEYIEFVIGERIEFIQYNLKKQVAKALGTPEECRECEREACEREARDREAEVIVDKFLSRIPEIREYLSKDIEAAYNGDPAAYSTEEIIFSYPGVFTTMVYRIAHELWELKVPMIPRIMTELAHSKTGIDIHPGAKIGKYFFIDHGTGIVIGETTVIGDNVKIYQGVTLGGLSTRKGQQLKGVKRHPTIGDNVTIYSGTSILGGETVIGNDATIGGNAFIVSSVSEGMKVSIKNPELEFTRAGESKKDEFWDWCI